MGYECGTEAEAEVEEAEEEAEEAAWALAEQEEALRRAEAAWRRSAQAESSGAFERLLGPLLGVMVISASMHGSPSSS